MFQRSWGRIPALDGHFSHILVAKIDTVWLKRPKIIDKRSRRSGADVISNFQSWVTTLL